MTPPFKVAIPARYGASRLPGKPLLPLAGRPMIAHVCERALASGAETVIVCTDDRRIADAVRDLPVRAVLTAPEHPSGTARIAEMVDRLRLDDDEIIVNLQGDEPLMPPRLIGQVAAALAEDTHAAVATCCTPIHDRAELFDPHAVKVVPDGNGRALYFSRAPIPFARDAFAEAEAPLPEGPFYRHIGLYAYRAGFLRHYVRWPVSPLETLESLEQLRVLWHGAAIRVLQTAEAPAAGVDTSADLARVEALLAA